MSGEPIEVENSILEDVDLEKLMLDQYALEEPFTYELFSSNLNDVHVVKASGNTYYLRISIANVRNKEDLKNEVEILKVLDTEGIPVVKMLRNQYGEYLTEISTIHGHRYGVLFLDAKGNKKSNPNVEQNYLVGKTLARIHNCIDKSNLHCSRIEMDVKTLLDEPLKIIEPWLSHRVEDWEYLKETGHVLKKYVVEHQSKQKPQYGICHGDFHYGNMHFDDFGNLTVFDFDNCGYGWRAYDIACYLFSRIEAQIREAEEMTQDTWDSFMKGYTDERMLSSDELKAIDAFVAIRMIWCRGTHLTYAKENPNMEQPTDRIFDVTVSFIKERMAVRNII